MMRRRNSIVQDTAVDHNRRASVADALLQQRSAPPQQVGGFSSWRCGARADGLGM
jgi:hypothetical protein